MLFTLTDDTREVCLVVSTIQDLVVEDVEEFAVILRSEDPSVELGLSDVTGSILDDDEGKSTQDVWGMWYEP